MLLAHRLSPILNNWYSPLSQIIYEIHVKLWEILVFVFRHLWELLNGCNLCEKSIYRVLRFPFFYLLHDQHFLLIPKILISIWSDPIWLTHGSVHTRICNAWIIACVLRSHYMLRHRRHFPISIGTSISLIQHHWAKWGQSTPKCSMHACFFAHT